MFLVTQLKPVPASTSDFFQYLHLTHFLLVFVESNTDATKSFGVDHLLNKQMI